MTTVTAPTSPTQKGAAKENPLVNLLFNVILPVIILNQLSKRGGPNGPTIALIAGLAIPMAYGLIDYVQNKRKNWLSLFGIINIAFTGGLALFELEGVWFALKEAAFPFIIGVGVLASQMVGEPFFKKMFWNPNVFEVEKVERSVAARGDVSAIPRLFRRANQVFALSFFISSALNFILAHRIFTKIDPNLASDVRKTILNEQIAQMTWQGYVVIALPLMLLMMGIIYYLVRELRRLSGLPAEEIFKA